MFDQKIAIYSQSEKHKNKTHTLLLHSFIVGINDILLMLLIPLGDIIGYFILFTIFVLFKLILFDIGIGTIKFLISISCSLQIILLLGFIFVFIFDFDFNFGLCFQDNDNWRKNKKEETRKKEQRTKKTKTRGIYSMDTTYLLLLFSLGDDDNVL